MSYYRVARHAGRRGAQWKILLVTDDIDKAVARFNKVVAKIRAGGVYLVEIGELGPDVISVQTAPWLRTRW